MQLFLFWAQEFQKLYPNEFKVYFEDENFVCYYIEQNVYRLYNFAIDCIIIDSVLWEHKHYGIQIDDYVWIPTKVLILPSCRHIGEGAVISSGSVVAKNVEPMSVVSGNPAKELRKRKCVHSELVVESLLGGDYLIYKMSRNYK